MKPGNRRIFPNLVRVISSAAWALYLTVRYLALLTPYKETECSAHISQSISHMHSSIFIYNITLLNLASTVVLMLRTRHLCGFNLLIRVSYCSKHKLPTEYERRDTPNCARFHKDMETRSKWHTLDSQDSSLLGMPQHDPLASQRVLINIIISRSSLHILSQTLNRSGRFIFALVACTLATCLLFVEQYSCSSTISVCVENNINIARLHRMESDNCSCCSPDTGDKMILPTPCVFLSLSQNRANVTIVF